MILFRHDWLRYPQAIIDLQTRNRSAIELAAKLRVMGVENNAFFLALHNPALQGIDPFSESLTQREMLDIGIEIKTNPWYYFREIARAPAIAGTNSSPIELNRANIALWWCFFNHITTMLTQPRQTGKSFSADHLSQGLSNFWCNNTQINLLTKDDKLRAENIKRLKDIYEELPEYLKFKTREDANNTEEISIKRLGNTYKTHVPNASPKRANNIGRGMTTPVFLIDEAPFQPNIDIALPAALAAMGAAIDAAKAQGAPYGVVMTTTAGRKDEKEGAYVYSLIERSAQWTEKFYDALNEIELHAMVKTNGRGNLRIYLCFSHTQLGKDDAWLQEKLSLTNATPEAANRDFFNVWTSGTASSPIPMQLAERINRSRMDPLHHSIAKTNAYVVRWYIEEAAHAYFMTNNDVILGIDTSDAIGNDDISLVFTSVRSGKTIGVAAVNDTNLITFAMYLVEMLIKWPRVTMIMERRGSAATILDYLLLFLPQHGIDPFKRIFNWVANDPLEYKDRAAEMHQTRIARPVDTYTRSKKYFGFATSGTGQTSRSELYSTTLMNAVKRNCDSVHDNQLATQILGLVSRNGRIDHALGEHDDLVIGWLMTHWFLTQAKNLAWYGIDTSQLLVEAATTTPRTSEEQFSDFMQLQVRMRMNELFELMATEHNSFLTERYEQELRQLDKRLILQDGDNFSLDSFLRELNEKRKKNRVTHNTPADMNDRSYVRELGYSDGRPTLRDLRGQNVYVL